MNMDVGYDVRVTHVQKLWLDKALQTQENVIKRQINTESSDDVKAIRRSELAHVQSARVAVSTATPVAARK